MKKRGYTLIELIAVIAVISILFGSGFTIVKMLNNIKNEAELDYAVYEVNSILSYAKAYCRRNIKEGQIVIDAYKNSILFQYRRNDNVNIVVKSEELPNDIKISTSSLSSINVSNSGYLGKSGTILINGNGKQRIITIAVGNDLITVQSLNKIKED